MIKQTYRYDHSSSRLEVEGLPDYSAGHMEYEIGIISGWKLHLVGLTELEGNREHLECLMKAVNTYARYRISGVRKACGNPNSPVSINPGKYSHTIHLKSSKPDIKPLTIELDDSELSDLVRCLDSLRHDQRVKVIWKIKEELPLRRQELVESFSLIRRLAVPFSSGIIFSLFTLIVISVPLPSETDLINPSKSEQIQGNS